MEVLIMLAMLHVLAAAAAFAFGWRGGGVWFVVIASIFLFPFGTVMCIIAYKLGQAMSGRPEPERESH